MIKTEMKSMEENNWIMTDDATMQHVRHLGNRRYEIIDSVRLPNDTGYVSRRIIDLNDYEMDEDFCRLYLKPYDYADEAAVRKLYGEAADQIIAECVAETEIWEAENVVFRDKSRACLSHIRSVVKPMKRRSK